MSTQSELNITLAIGVIIVTVVVSRIAYTGAGRIVDYRALRGRSP